MRFFGLSVARSLSSRQRARDRDSFGTSPEGCSDACQFAKVTGNSNVMSVPRGNTDRLGDSKSARDRTDEWYSYTALCKHGGAAPSIAAAASKFLIGGHLFQPLRNVHGLVLNPVKVGCWAPLRVEDVKTQLAVIVYRSSQSRINDVFKTSPTEQSTNGHTVKPGQRNARFDI